MKKIVLIFILCMSTMYSCSPHGSSNRENTTQTNTELSSQNIETTEKVIEIQTTSETVQPETTQLNKAENLNLGEVYEYILKNNFNTKFIFFTNYGRYYYVEIGGRDSANFVLCLDRGSGDPQILTETEDSSVIYSDENALYLLKFIRENNTYVRCKLEDDNLTAIDEYPFEYEKYFANEYFYYPERNNDIVTVYRMDQDKNNTEKVIDLPEDVDNYTIYDNKIWYDYSRAEGFSYYDLITGETVDFNKGKVGIINNGYMYYTYHAESSGLMRFDLSSGEYEVVFETEKNQNLFAFNFYKDSILYCSGDSVYRYNDNEQKQIFSAEDHFNSEGYYMGGIQCEDDRIYIEICSGAFYHCIMEIDIDGNIIEVIHED